MDFSASLTYFVFDWFPWNWALGISMFLYSLKRWCGQAVTKVLDFKNFIYIPYKAGGSDKVLTIRRPNGPIQWAFVAAFVSTMGVLVYKMAKATSRQRYSEAKRKVVIQYRKYLRLGLFSIIFPMACNNTADEIIAFVTHVGIYYKQVMGVVDMVVDAGSVVSDITSLFDDEDHDDRYSEAARPICTHSRDCDVRSTSGPCNLVCGGHHCVHSKECSPTSIRETSSENKTQAGEAFVDDTTPSVVHDMMSDSDSDDGYNSVDEDAKEVFTDGVPSPRPTQREIYATSRLNELLLMEEQARDRLANGGSRFGLGYNPKFHKPSGIWIRVKARFSLLWAKLNLWLLHQRYKIISFLIRYQWWLIGGASLAAITTCVVVCSRLVPSLRYSEGGKKRKKTTKKEKADRREVRKQTANRTEVTHKVSGGDETEDYQRWLDKKDEQKRQDREDAIAYEQRWSSEGKFFKDMTRKELLAKIQYFRNRECVGPKENRERRQVLADLFEVLNEKFPKDPSKKSGPAVATTAVTEHLRPGSLPFATPVVYLVTATRKGVPIISTCFAYAGGLYVPRHVCAGADKVVVHNGGKTIELPDKCVCVTNLPDLVMYPLPAGMMQNVGMKFRAPKQGEIATLFYVRANTPTKTHQTVGIVGKNVHLGGDRSLVVTEYDGTSEYGSCGGVYIARNDGYCIGYHGIGNDDVTVCPMFYPMEEGWYEKAKNVAKQLPTYTPVEDVNYQDKISKVLNNQAPLESLNF